MISRLLPYPRPPLPPERRARPERAESSGRSGSVATAGGTAAASTAERHFRPASSEPRGGATGPLSPGEGGASGSPPLGAGDFPSGERDDGVDRDEDALGKRYSLIVRRSSSVRRRGLPPGSAPDGDAPGGGSFLRSRRALRAASRSRSRALSRSCRSRALLQRDSPPLSSGTCGCLDQRDRYAAGRGCRTGIYRLMHGLGQDERHQWCRSRELLDESGHDR